MSDVDPKKDAEAQAAIDAVAVAKKVYVYEHRGDECITEGCRSVETTRHKINGKFGDIDVEMNVPVCAPCWKTFTAGSLSGISISPRGFSPA